MKPFIEDNEGLENIQPQTQASAAPVAQASTAAAPAQQQAVTLPSAPPPAVRVETTPVASSATATDEGDDDAPSQKSASKGSTDYDVDFDDESATKKTGLEILKPEKGKTVRFALLTDYVKPKIVFNHYIEKKGTFHCLTPEDKSGVCCVGTGKDSASQLIALVLYYSNANPKNGSYKKDESGVVPPIEWEVRAVRLSRTAHGRIKGLQQEEDAKITDIDITMSKGEDNRFEFNRIGAARWKKNPALVKEVEAALKPYINDNGKKLVRLLGKKITKLEWQSLLAGSKPASEEADLSDISDI